MGGLLYCTIYHLSNYSSINLSIYLFRYLYPFLFYIRLSTATEDTHRAIPTSSPYLVPLIQSQRAHSLRMVSTQILYQLVRLSVPNMNVAVVVIAVTLQIRTTAAIVRSTPNVMQRSHLQQTHEFGFLVVRNHFQAIVAINIPTANRMVCRTGPYLKGPHASEGVDHLAMAV